MKLEDIDAEERDGPAEQGAMMTSCACFARRVKRVYGFSEMSCFTDELMRGRRAIPIASRFKA
ncbi:hypothetical protein [Bradyrhizobium guangdongense]|uniref:hypothetical protein n=1 Tax=Bradyrhizobium guangdongense TaxID=1325090 RepID=UPI0016678B6C|nr:hypothetical protein [Bradyrhizobium guangdongense]